MMKGEMTGFLSSSVQRDIFFEKDLSEPPDAFTI